MALGILCFEKKKKSFYSIACPYHLFDIFMKCSVVWCAEAGTDPGGPVGLGPPPREREREKEKKKRKGEREGET